MPEDRRFQYPVIAVSADAMPETTHEVLALGAMAYVTKQSSQETEVNDAETFGN